MSEKTLIVNFKPPGEISAPTDGSVWLRLRQADWSELAADGFVDWLGSNGYLPVDPEKVFELYAFYQSQCDPDGEATARVFVESSPGLEYSLRVAHGEIEGPVEEEETGAKTFSIEKSASKLSIDDLGYTITVLHSYEWETCFVNGEEVPGPEVILVDGVPTWGMPVVGVLRLRVTFTRVFFTIAWQPSSDTDNHEDAWSNTVIAKWVNGPTFFSMTPPPEEGNCKGGVGTGVDPAKECVRLIIYVDPCTGEKLREEEIPEECPEE